jgi:hypothetical protein
LDLLNAAQSCDRTDERPRWETRGKLCLQGASYLDRYDVDLADDLPIAEALAFVVLGGRLAVDPGTCSRRVAVRQGICPACHDLIGGVERPPKRARIQDRLGRGRELQRAEGPNDDRVPPPSQAVAPRNAAAVTAGRAALRGGCQPGQEVEVWVDGYPERHFAGTVAQIAGVSEFTPRNVQSAYERRHQLFGVKVRVVDPQGVFKSGMAAEVVLSPPA